MAIDAPIEPDSAVEPLSEAALAQFRPVFDLIEWSADDDGTGMLLRMLEAETWEDLNTEQSLPALKDLAPCRLKILGIRKRESEMDGRMPIYLIVEAINLATGGAVTFNTGAGNPFIALAMLNKFGNFPAIVEVRAADKLTKRGYRPLNLTVEGAESPKKPRR